MHARVRAGIRGRLQHAPLHSTALAQPPLPRACPLRTLEHRGGESRLAERGFKREGVADDRAYTRAWVLGGMRPWQGRLGGGWRAAAPAQRVPRSPAGTPVSGTQPRSCVPPVCRCAGAIKGMRKAEYEELSEEQILAARRRRQREVAK